MARAQTIIVTGDKEVDRALKALEPKLRNKALKKASRDAAKNVLEEYKRVVPVESGAMRDSAKVRVMKKKKDAMGHSVILDRDRLFALAKARGKQLSIDRKRGNEPFFYPSVVEFGDKDTEAQRPLRKALFDKETAHKAFFMRELRKQLSLPTV
jgi:HK97 gp10 family phage protein